MAQAEQIDDETLSGADIEPAGTPSAADTEKISAGRRSVISDLEALRAREQASTTEQIESLKKKELAQGPVRTEAIEAMRAREAAGEALAAQPVPSMGQPPKLQSFMDRDTANMMAGVASLIAGFNSNGRIRGVRANQSLAAGISGYMKGSYMKAQLGLEDWKNQVQAQLAEFKLMRQQKLDILNASGMTLEDKLAEIKLVGAPYDNELIRAKIEKEGIDGVLAIDKEMAQIIDRTEKTLAKANEPIKLTTEQYKLKLMQRAQGLTTGDPDVDQITPENAKRGAGLEPKPTAASTKARDQLIGTSNVLKEIEALIPEMDEKGFLAKEPGKIAQEFATFRRWKNAADPTMAKWKSLQGSIVGFDRSVFNDIGARVKSAYEGSLNLFDQPFTAEGLRQAIGGYRRILEDSPEAKRALAQDPEAFSGGGPRPGARSGAPEVMRSKSKSGRPIWKLPNETEWHYDQ